MLSLVVREGAARGTIYRLGTRVLTVGRGPQNPVQLVDGEVSRRHALIRWTGSRYVITDLKSHNGTFVGNELLASGERALEAGDSIRMGRTVLAVVPDERGAPDAVLGSKDVKPEARVATIPSSARERDGDDGIIDVDAEAERRAMRVTKLAASLKEATRSGRHRSLIYKQALLGMIGLVGADRVAAFRIGPNHDPEMEASATADEQGVAGSDQSLSWDVVRAVVSGGAATLVGAAGSSDAAGGTVVHPAHGSIIAVPVKDGGETVGVLYADSSSVGNSLFVQDDLEILEAVGRALAPTFASSSRRPAAARLAG